MRTIETILSSLVEATEKGALKWNEGDGTDKFETSFGKYNVHISHWFNGDTGEFGYTAQLRANGEVLDSVTASEFSAKVTLLEPVYEAARRSFHDIDAVIGQVEKELSKLLKK